MIRNGKQLKQARMDLGLSIGELSDALRLSPASGNRMIRRMENNDINVTGPVAVAMEAMLAGYEPEYLGVDDDYS